MEVKIDTNDSKITNLRLKCDKCHLYIDQHNFYSHHNECLGRGLTIPCEICYCPVFIDDYEQHMLICNNDDNSTLSQFLYKHLHNPNIEEKMIKLFICSWRRKHRGSIDIYEMIEEFNQTNGICLSFQFDFNSIFFYEIVFSKEQILSFKNYQSKKIIYRE